MIEGSGIILVPLILGELLVANYFVFITLTQVILMATIMKYTRDTSKMSKSLAPNLRRERRILDFQQCL
jgi:hypothetical protein